MHNPVFLHEVIDGLNVTANQIYFDCTVGSAGHAAEIARLGGKVIGLDVDPDALKLAKDKLPQAKFVQANFSELFKVAESLGITRAAGVLLDLGLSSNQLADSQRGFSFQTDGPLDMRQDPRLTTTAADLVNKLSEAELYQLFTDYGEEPRALAIASAIVKKRPLTTTVQLAELVAAVVRHRGKTNPATQVFQALRISVNQELANLKAVLPQAIKLLKPGGRLAVISFHSLEDRIVKNFMKQNQQLKNLTKHPLKPARAEVLNNPRSRSAKLRLGEKI